MTNDWNFCQKKQPRVKTKKGLCNGAPVWIIGISLYTSSLKKSTSYFTRVRKPQSTQKVLIKSVHRATTKTLVQLEFLWTITTISAQTAIWSGVAQLCAKGRHSGIKTKSKKDSKVPCWRLNTLACWGLQQQREVTLDKKGKTATGISRQSRGGEKNGQGADGLSSPTMPTKALMSNAGSRKLFTAKNLAAEEVGALYKPGTLLQSKWHLACRVICLWTYVHSENVHTDGRKNIDQDCVCQFVKFGYILS